MKWIIALLVILLYVHLFNAVSTLYFDSGREMTFMDLVATLKQNVLRNM